MTDDKIEAAAREAESKYEHRSPHWRLGFRTGYEEGYVSIRGEIASLRAKLSAMREPLWMLREEHEAETAKLRARLEAAEARVKELEENEYNPLKQGA